MSTESTDGEPFWRVVLNYGCVFYFLFLPAIAILLSLMRVELHPVGVPSFLREFHLAVTALVATMAGLNSFDRRNVNGKSDEKVRTNVDKRIISPPSA